MLYFLFFLIAPVMVYASQPDICDVGSHDWIILKTSVGVERDNAYGRGSVWTRHGKAFGGVAVFYIPEEVSEGGYRQCRMISMRKALPKNVGDGLQRHIDYVFREGFDEVRERKQSLMRNDGNHWSYVDGIKKVFTNGRYGTDGGLQPHADSWARCVPVCPKSPSDKVLEAGDEQGDHYGCGALWLSCEDQGAVLCHKPFGCESLVYRCALNRPENAWPACWNGVRDVVERFAKSDCKSLQEFAPEQADNVIRMAEAALYGRISGTAKNMWFSWRPVSGDRDPILNQQCKSKKPLKSRLIKGLCAEGFYTKGSAWFVEDHKKNLYWYYRSDDDFVFRYDSGVEFQPHFTMRGWPFSKNDGELWLRVVDEFILLKPKLRDTRGVTA